MRSERVAWVESPLQLLGALEHALATGEALEVVPRSGDAQLEHTAAHLADRLEREGLPTVRIALDRRLLPARIFRADEPWLVGDAYSGQVQARLDRAEPASLTLVDDGAITRWMARQLQAGEPLLRPRAPRLFGGLRRELASRTTRRLRRFASEGRLSITTFLNGDDAAVASLKGLGAIVTSHSFEASRRFGQRAADVPPGARIVLGSAAVADRLCSPGDELARLGDLARGGVIAYLPHRREPQWFLTAVSRLRNVVVIPARLPIELALAGSARPLEIIAPTSTAAETLPLVLHGTGSVVRPHPAAPEAVP